MAGIFDITKTDQGHYCFQLKASNGQVVLSSDAYRVKAEVLHRIASVKKNAPDDDRYDRRKSQKKEPYFILKSASGQVLGKSDIYSSRISMENIIAAIKKHAPTTETHDVSDV